MLGLGNVHCLIKILNSHSVCTGKHYLKTMPEISVHVMCLHPFNGTHFCNILTFQEVLTGTVLYETCTQNETDVQEVVHETPRWNKVLYGRLHSLYMIVDT